MEAPRLSPEEGFREALEDAVSVIKKLAPVCGTFDEMTGVCELALTNDAQLRLLMKTVLEPEKAQPGQPNQRR